MLQELSTFGLSQSLEYQAALMVAEIQKELDLLAKKHDADGVLEKLSLQMKPHKALAVKQKTLHEIIVDRLHQGVYLTHDTDLCIRHFKKVYSSIMGYESGSRRVWCVGLRGEGFGV